MSKSKLRKFPSGVRGVAEGHAGHRSIGRSGTAVAAVQAPLRNHPGSVRRDATRRGATGCGWRKAAGQGRLAAARTFVRRVRGLVEHLPAHDRSGTVLRDAHARTQTAPRHPVVRERDARITPRLRSPCGGDDDDDGGDGDDDDDDGNDEGDRLIFPYRRILARLSCTRANFAPRRSMLNST